jgi:hypothetical protein
MATQSGQNTIVAVQDKVIPAQISFSTSTTTASGSLVNLTMYPYGFNNPTTTTSFQVPAGSHYQLADVYVSSTPAVDGQLVFQLNGIPQGENFILSTLVASNSARVKPTQPLVLKAGDVITAQLSTTASAGTSSIVDTVYLHFLQVPA